MIDWLWIWVAVVVSVVPYSYVIARVASRGYFDAKLRYQSNLITKLGGFDGKQV